MTYLFRSKDRRYYLPWLKVIQKMVANTHTDKTCRGKAHCRGHLPNLSKFALRYHHSYP